MPQLVMDTDICTECEPVQLQPFIHQVGGHTSMLRFDDTTLCKPLITRELQFYKSLPGELKEFTPEYRGIIEVQLREDSDGYITLIGYPPECREHSSPEQRKSSPDDIHRSSSSSLASTESDVDVNYAVIKPRRVDNEPIDAYSMRLLRSGSIEVSTQTDKIFHSPDPKAEHSKTESLNPWSLKCHKKQLAKMRKMNQKSDSYEFILLENVAAQFQSPCILDLKMGTRQHGDDAPEHKVKSQTRKCEATTSSAIGVRLCGMQVLQSSTGKYICQNKYFGRSLTVDGFREALHQFLHNGCELRTDLIGPITRQLDKLRRMLERQDTFRFYSSSLLIMYDGGDFQIMDDSTNKPCDTLEKSGEGEGKKKVDFSHNCLSNSWAQCNTKVDVRMIDFAHATYTDFRDDKTVHSGPDHGYIYGLENLVKLFQDIQTEYGLLGKNDNS